MILVSYASFWFGVKSKVLLPSQIASLEKGYKSQTTSPLFL